MKYHIREANPVDMPAVLKLIQELAIFEKEPKAVELTLAELTTEGFGPNPLFYCFVAEMDQKIVGTAICYYRFSTWKGRSVHLEDLIVTKSMRRQGIGNSLYKEVLAFANRHGVRRVEWAVLDWNTPAIEFYEQSGATLLKDWFLAQMDAKKVKSYLANH